MALGKPITRYGVEWKDAYWRVGYVGMNAETYTGKIVMLGFADKAVSDAYRDEVLRCIADGEQAPPADKYILDRAFINVPHDVYHEMVNQSENVRALAYTFAVTSPEFDGAVSI